MTQAARSFGVPVVIILALAVAIVLATCAAVWWRSGRSFGADFVARAVIGSASWGWATAVFLLTLRPAARAFDGGRHVSWVPFRDLTSMVGHSVWWQVPATQICGNAAIFVFFGMVVTIRFRSSWLTVVVAGTGVAIGIETIQYFVVTGRVASTDDVLLAAFGSLIGAALTRAVRRARQRFAEPCGRVRS